MRLTPGDELAERQRDASRAPTRTRPRRPRSGAAAARLRRARPCEIAADRPAVADLRRADGAGRLGERRQERRPARRPSPRRRSARRRAGASRPRRDQPRSSATSFRFSTVSGRARSKFSADHHVGPALDRQRLGCSPSARAPRRASVGSGSPRRELYGSGHVALTPASVTYAGATIVTMDDAGHRVRARLAPRRGRPVRRTRRRRPAGPGRGPARRGRHAGARQHPPPPLPDAHPRARAGRRPLHVAARRSTRSGRESTRRCSYAAARTGLAELALSGCSTVFDHHYVFPRGVSGLVEAEIRAAARARRPHRRLARLDGPRRLGRRAAAGRPRRGDRRRARRHRAAGRARRRRPRRRSPSRPCSPFSVTTRLMEESAALARRLGLALHTHLAETRRGGRLLP